MKKTTVFLVLLALAAMNHPAYAAEKQKAASAVEKQKAAPAVQKADVPPVLSAEELAARSLKGVENQRAWVATLEKQLDGEKNKLAQIEADHDRTYGSKTKAKAASDKD